MENSAVAPRTEWNNLSLSELYKTKLQMTDLYFKAASAGATYSAQYARFISEIEALISQREMSEFGN